MVTEGLVRFYECLVQSSITCEVQRHVHKPPRNRGGLMQHAPFILHFANDPLTIVGARKFILTFTVHVDRYNEN